MQGGGSVGLQCKGAAVLVYSARGQQCWFTVQGAELVYSARGNLKIIKNKKATKTNNF